MTDARRTAEDRLLKAPWTCREVVALNDWQERGDVHPFTCGGNNCREVLIAGHEGWHCPACDYTQDWAHRFMALRAAPASPDPLQGIRDAKYLNPVCAADGCQWLRAIHRDEEDDCREAQDNTPSKVTYPASAPLPAPDDDPQK